MNKEHVRFYIKTRTALNIHSGLIHDELCSAYGDQAPSLRTVERWCQLFREGREEVEDQARLGRPVTETTSENIEQVRLLIDDDPYMTIEEMQEQTDLSYGTIHRIITDHLKLKKITARYIPKDLTDFQRAERVRVCKENLAKFQGGTWRLCDIITGDESWFYHKKLGRKSSNAAWVRSGDPPPTVVRQSKYAPRTLLSIFFKSNGPLLIHRLERGQTMDHQYYINNCLQPLVDEIKRQRPSYGTRGIKIHHDNGRPHVHKDVSNYLESEGLTIIQHPPNSPDLSPCDFWLFDLIKENLTDQSDSESLYDAVTNFMYSLNKEEYRKTFEKWTQRMQLCIDNQGDYFEHLIK
jgi:histone-lysine N-methyltransferase SETMAR